MHGSPSSGSVSAAWPQLRLGYCSINQRSMLALALALLCSALLDGRKRRRMYWTVRVVDACDCTRSSGIYGIATDPETSLLSGDRPSHTVKYWLYSADPQCDRLLIPAAGGHSSISVSAAFLPMAKKKKTREKKDRLLD